MGRRAAVEEAAGHAGRRAVHYSFVLTLPPATTSAAEVKRRWFEVLKRMDCRVRRAILKPGQHAPAWLHGGARSTAAVRCRRSRCALFMSAAGQCPALRPDPHPNAQRPAPRGASPALPPTRRRVEVAPKSRASISPRPAPSRPVRGFNRASFLRRTAWSWGRAMW